MDGERPLSRSGNRGTATANRLQPRQERHRRNGGNQAAVKYEAAPGFDLRNARPFNCCDGILPSPTRSFELVGLIGSRRYEVIIDVFFGTTPTGRLWANAQQAVRRIQLPRGR